MPVTELKTFMVTILAHDPKMPQVRDSWDGDNGPERTWEPITVKRKARNSKAALAKVLDQLFDHGLVPLEEPKVEEVV
jgi:hypothetical protein